jgi:hypothetical protein
MLKKAGVSTLQVGIESLSSELLSLMHKGVSARQNIACLRYFASAGLAIAWNLLWGIPGDTLEMYQGTLDLLPLMHHLPPPASMIHLVVARYSPYFEHPEAYGVYNVRPLSSVFAAFPPHADLDKLSLYFAADYASQVHQNMDVIVEIKRELGAWQDRWSRPSERPPLLHVVDLGENYVLVDTRNLAGTDTTQVLSRAQAAAALVARPCVEMPELTWALEHKIGVLLDAWYVPLATARPELLRGIESEFAGWT